MGQIEDLQALFDLNSLVMNRDRPARLVNEVVLSRFERLIIGLGFEQKCVSLLVDWESTVILWRAYFLDCVETILEMMLMLAYSCAEICRSPAPVRIRALPDSRERSVFSCWNLLSLRFPWERRSMSVRESLDVLDWLIVGAEEIHALARQC